MALTRPPPAASPVSGKLLHLFPPSPASGIVAPRKKSKWMKPSTRFDPYYQQTSICPVCGPGQVRLTLINRACGVHGGGGGAALSALLYAV